MLRKHRSARHTALQQHAVLVTRAPCAFWSNPGGLVIDSSSWVNTPFLLFLFNLQTPGWIPWQSECSRLVILYTFATTSVLLLIGWTVYAFFVCPFRAITFQEAVCAEVLRYTSEFSSVSSAVCMQCVSSVLSVFPDSGWVDLCRQTDSWINRSLWAEPPTGCRLTKPRAALQKW